MLGVWIMVVSGRQVGRVRFRGRSGLSTFGRASGFGVVVVEGMAAALLLDG